MHGTAAVPRAIIRKLLRRNRDCEVVGELTDRRERRDAIRAPRPDVPVIGLRDADIVPSWSQWLVEHPPAPTAAA
jgi:chemotaxis response regulator CheB